VVKVVIFAPRWWYAEATLFGGRRCAKNFFAVETRLFNIGTQHVDEGKRLGHGLDIGKLQVVDIGEMIEHAVELLRITLYIGG
jgi:hypothetical protein